MAALVKIADSLLNMRTIELKSLEKQHEIARDTVRMYVPLVDEIGAKEIAEELDAICMRVLPAKQYLQVHEASRQYRREIEEKGYYRNKLGECVIPKKLK